MIDANVLIARAQSEGTPIIDGDTAYFIWEGEAAARLIGDFNNWGTAKPEIVPGQIAPGVWQYALTLPRTAYIEYNFVSPSDVEDRYGNPLATSTVDSGIGHKQHAFAMPEYITTRLTKAKRGVPQGKVSKHRIESDDLLVGGKRDLYLYQPPVLDPVPLIVVFDGKDFYRRAALPVIVDNLIAAGRIHPVALAMIDNKSSARFIEYGASDATVRLVRDVVTPAAYEHLNLIDINAHPGSFAVMGASMGGLQALYTALRLPSIFRGVISFSGAFNRRDWAYVIWDLLLCAPVDGLRVWLTVGEYDFPGLAASNPLMRDTLEARGVSVAYSEYMAGHNYPAWASEAHHGLEWLLRL